MSAVPLTDRGRRTRDALISAARGVFEVRGYDATRMGDIAEAAGVSHGTVYTWFSTKDAVLMAVIESLVGDLYASLGTPDETDPVARVDLANRRYLDAYRANARLLEVVEQARAAGVTTSGAQAGGAVPDFLRGTDEAVATAPAAQPAQPAGGVDTDLIESLLRKPTDDAGS